MPLRSSGAINLTPIHSHTRGRGKHNESHSQSIFWRRALAALDLVVVRCAMQDENPMWCMSGSWGAYSAQKLAVVGQEQEPRAAPPSPHLPPPPPSGHADEALAAVLSGSSLLHLEGRLEGETLTNMGALDRQALLAHLKARGLSLPDRQKLATAVAKASRAQPETTNSTVAAKPRIEPEAQGFSIYCHRTTLQDGTSLDNSDPAPEFIIAELEQRTGRKRPSDAATCSLERLNLYFMGSI